MYEASKFEFKGKATEFFAMHVTDDILYTWHVLQNPCIVAY